MGGHGGLNILPQKSWNVYNFENREKVRKDEEAAARDEQQKLEQSRRQDFEFCIQKLRQARNLSDPTTAPAPAPAPASSSISSHINLFENFADFESNNSNDKSKSLKLKEKEDKKSDGGKKRKREDGPAKVVITAEDEKYRLGYGLAGKGVRAPWYLSRPQDFVEEERGSASSGERKRSGGKKSIEELREERMRRERKEKERERALLSSKNKGADKGFSRRRL